MEHGTVEKYRQELREQEKDRGPGPCTLCRRAQAQYLAEYRKTRARDRSEDTRKATIRRRALNRLAERYPEDYKDILAYESSMYDVLEGSR